MATPLKITLGESRVWRSSNEIMPPLFENKLTQLKDRARPIIFRVQTERDWSTTEVNLTKAAIASPLFIEPLRAPFSAPLQSTTPGKGYNHMDGMTARHSLLMSRDFSFLALQPILGLLWHLTTFDGKMTNTVLSTGFCCSQFVECSIVIIVMSQSLRARSCAGISNAEDRHDGNPFPFQHQNIQEHSNTTFAECNKDIR